MFGISERYVNGLCLYLSTYIPLLILTTRFAFLVNFREILCIRQHSLVRILTFSKSFAVTMNDSHSKEKWFVVIMVCLYNFCGQNCWQLPPDNQPEVLVCPFICWTEYDAKKICFVGNWRRCSRMQWICCRNFGGAKARQPDIDTDIDFWKMRYLRRSKGTFFKIFYFNNVFKMSYYKMFSS